MADRENLIELIRECNKFHEEAKEKWILAGKQGERPNLIGSLADHLIANGVVVRENGEWLDRRIFCFDGCIDCWECSVCGCRKVGREYFCPNCGADMRKEENG